MRGGLLGQGSILTITSYATRTSPVLRGKWVLENLLASPPPPPPPDVPALKTEGARAGHDADDARSDDRASRQSGVRQLSRADGSDRLRAWRTSTPSGAGATTDGGAPIDASGAFPEGTAFAGVAGLKQELVRHPEPFIQARRRAAADVRAGPQPAGTMTRRRCARMLRDAAPQKYTLASLVLGVVKSRPFQMRQAAGAE